MLNESEKKIILKNLQKELAYKAPEQLAQIMGFVGKIDEDDIVEIQPKFLVLDEGEYMVGRLERAHKSQNRMCVIFDDFTYKTFG
tara:strand:- start:271 stop:525 length:255 start_codon:yes stop_codon:yes gene_type:complete